MAKLETALPQDNLPRRFDHRIGFYLEALKKEAEAANKENISKPAKPEIDIPFPEPYKTTIKKYMNLNQDHQTKISGMIDMYTVDE